MLTLIGYELKKIFMKRTNQIAMAAGFAIMAISVFALIRGNSVYDKETETYIKGIASFELEREQNERLTDSITPEFVAAELDALHKSGFSRMNEDEGYDSYRFIMDKPQFWSFIIQNYQPITPHSTMDYSALYDVTPEDGLRFYEAREQRVVDWLNMDFSYGNYTQTEKDYWLAKVRSVRTPFAWGCKANMNILWEFVTITMYCLFIIIFCVAPVFASEHESQAAALLRTTRQGMRRLNAAKLIASLGFALVYQTLVMLGWYLAEALAVGLYGADLPVQLWGTEIPYAWTVGKAIAVNVVVVLLVTLAVVAMTLLLSAKLKNSIATIGVAVAFTLGSTLLPFSRKSNLWNHINYLTPLRATVLGNALKTFESYRFGSVIISCVGMIFIVYALASVLCTTATLLSTRR